MNPKASRRVSGAYFEWQMLNVTEFMLKVLRRYRSNHQRFSIKLAVLENFAIFTEKHQCLSIFLINFI